jgi:hypothetical protein
LIGQRLTPTLGIGFTLRREEQMLLETVSGKFIAVTREHVERMTRGELQNHLELRGYAVYDDESTRDLRECALEDFTGECD